MDTSELEESRMGKEYQNGFQAIATVVCSSETTYAQEIHLNAGISLY